MTVGLLHFFELWQLEQTEEQDIVLFQLLKDETPNTQTSHVKENFPNVDTEEEADSENL